MYEDVISLNELVDLAKKNLMKEGVHPPTLIIIGTEGTSMHQVQSWSESDRIAYMTDLGAALYREPLGIMRKVFHVMEGWASKSAFELGVPVAQSQDRIEVFMVYEYDHKSKSQQIKMFEMIRDEAGTLIDLREIENLLQATAIISSLNRAFLRGYNRAKNSPRMPGTYIKPN
jgi:hypothetical protein